MSNRSAFLSLTKPIREVTLPDGPSVHVRSLTVVELSRLQSRVRSFPEGPDRDAMAGAALCAYALCDADGTPFFPDPSEADLAYVCNLAGRQVEAIAAAAAALNVPDKDAAKK